MLTIPALRRVCRVDHMEYHFDAAFPRLRVDFTPSTAAAACPCALTPRVAGTSDVTALQDMVVAAYGQVADTIVANGTASLVGDARDMRCLFELCRSRSSQERYVPAAFVRAALVAVSPGDLTIRFTVEPKALRLTNLVLALTPRLTAEFASGTLVDLQAEASDIDTRCVAYPELEDCSLRYVSQAPPAIDTEQQTLRRGNPGDVNALSGAVARFVSAQHRWCVDLPNGDGPWAVVTVSTATLRGIDPDHELSQRDANDAHFGRFVRPLSSLYRDVSTLSLDSVPPACRGDLRASCADFASKLAAVVAALPYVVSVGHVCHDTPVTDLFSKASTLPIHRNNPSPNAAEVPVPSAAVPAVNKRAAKAPRRESTAAASAGKRAGGGRK
jgi:hypothetical protein